MRIVYDIYQEGSLPHYLEHGQLCYIEKHYDCFLYHPIVFKDNAAAQRWIEDGCIADLQEQLSNLGVGFHLGCFERRIAGDA